VTVSATVTPIDKAALKAQLVQQLAEALDSARQAHAAAQGAATHAEARAENAKDTRGLEQSYLARGQAQRVAELEVGLAAVTGLAIRRFAPDSPIALGALVTVRERGEASGTSDRGVDKRLFVAPHGGGSVLGDAVQVVTPSSPLGRALLGKRIDDDVELTLSGRSRSLVVLDVT